MRYFPDNSKNNSPVSRPAEVYIFIILKNYELVNILSKKTENLHVIIALFPEAEECEKSDEELSNVTEDSVNEY